jgi:amidase
MSLSADPSRRHFLQAGMLGGLTLATATAAAPAEVAPFEFEEATITDLQAAMRDRKITPGTLVKAYMDRIEAIDRHGPTLRSVLEVNPDARSQAEVLVFRDTREQKENKGTLQGPLHGIPVLIKDNIDTADNMATTAGSLALVGAKPPSDAFIVKKLRQAGAILLGKTNLSEWANIRSNRSSSGWSGRGGQTHNPYVLDRNPSGSSSGSGAAVSANLCTVAVGTETDGSIVSPSNANGIVGMKPTVGLVSRTGIIPISHTQDTAGPMCRTVRDAAILLGVLAGVDPEDEATAASKDKGHTDYTQFLEENGLKGARIGVVRGAIGHPLVRDLFSTALEVLKKHGATLVDPANIPTQGRYNSSEITVLLYELKADLNAYLARLGPNAPVKSLEEIIAFNEKHKDKEMPFFGQEFFIQAQAKGPLTTPEYKEAVERGRRLAGKEGIDAVMDKNKLDALIAPTGAPAWMIDLVYGDRGTGGSSSAPAVSGYPNITVPMGFVHSLPVGLSFFGRAWSEPVLLKLAYAFEQATKHRKPPKFLPTVGA